MKRLSFNEAKNVILDAISHLPDSLLSDPFIIASKKFPPIPEITIEVFDPGWDEQRIQIRVFINNHSLYCTLWNAGFDTQECIIENFRFAVEDFWRIKKANEGEKQ